MKPRIHGSFRAVLIQLGLVLVLFGILASLYQGGASLTHITPEEMKLSDLPSALMLSLLRMSIAYSFSLVLAFLLGIAAARTTTGEKFILPVLDILQSVPVVGFFPVAISMFISASHGARWGLEAAAIFLILTSQAWNLAFAVYEAVKSLPVEIDEVSKSLALPASLRFLRVYAPACIPRLVPNSILSWSNGWFFLVACEIIAVGSLRYRLPGIGSFLASAAERDQTHLVFQGLLALIALILFLDFVVWRPLTRYAKRFLVDPESGDEDDGIEELAPTLAQWARPLAEPAGRISRAALYVPTEIAKRALVPYLWDAPHAAIRKFQRQWDRSAENLDPKGVPVMLGWALVVGASLWVGYKISYWMRPPWPAFAREIPLALLHSTLRLVIALLISLAWILPVIYLSWNRPKLRVTLNTIAQVGASLPATALFPLIILIGVRKFGGGMESASLFLLLMGMQWYVLFNAMGGTTVIPAELIEATKSFKLSRWFTWKRLVLPSIRPALITGLITAWGGGWNALVVSEYVIHKDRVMSVTGIGSLINRSVYETADPNGTLFCLMAMVGWIVLLNFLIWQPLYRNAIESTKGTT